MLFQVCCYIYVCVRVGVRVRVRVCRNWHWVQNSLDSIRIDSCPVTLIDGRILEADIRYDVLS